MARVMWASVVLLVVLSGTCWSVNPGFRTALTSKAMDYSEWVGVARLANTEHKLFLATHTHTSQHGIALVAVLLDVSTCLPCSFLPLFAMDNVCFQNSKYKHGVTCHVGMQCISIDIIPHGTFCEV